MSTLLDMLIPALASSVAAIAGLLLLPNAPTRFRLTLAVVGLAAWVIPWPWLEVPLDLPRVLDLQSAAGPSVTGFAELLRENAGAVDGARPVDYLGFALLALLVPGLAWLAADWLALRSALKRWRRGSQSGESLRSLLPEDLRTTRARIRVVPGTRVAAAAGWTRPTIWVGDQFADPADLRLALVHECWHIRTADPVWLVLITAIRRVYWWNPVAAYLAGQCELLIEAACDRRCMQSLGGPHYVERLATMMLDADGRAAPRLVAAAARNVNVQRLKLLQRQVRLRVRDCCLVGALAACAVIVIGGQVAEARGPDAPRAVSRVALPATPAGRALGAVLREVGGGDFDLVREYFGAYTPQEVAFERDDWAAGLEVLEILGSDRLTIEFVVGDATGGNRRLGRLQVADTAAIQVTAAEFHDIP